MKRIIFLCAFFLISVTVHAQVYKYSTTGFSYKSYNETYGYWGEWSDWEYSNLLVVLDLGRERITVYTDDLQEYDIYDVDEDQYDSDGDLCLSMSCVDQDGNRCGVRLLYNDNVEAMQLYIDYSNVTFVYNIEER